MPRERVPDILALITHLDPLNAPGIINAEKGVAEGALVFQTQKCASCHAIHGVGGKVGPALDGEGSRREREWLRKHFIDPPAMVPESIMPPYNLPQKEMNSLLEYLLAL